MNIPENAKQIEVNGATVPFLKMKKLIILIQV